MSLGLFIIFLSSICMLLAALAIKNCLKEGLHKAKYQYMEKEDYLFELLTKYCKDTTVGCNIIDEFRLKFYTDEYIKYDNYKLFAIKNNVILPHDYDDIFVQYFDEYPELKNDYAEYYSRLV